MIVSLPFMKKTTIGAQQYQTCQFSKNEGREKEKEGEREGESKVGNSSRTRKEKRKQSTEGTQCLAKYNWDFDIVHIIGKLQGIACMCAYACMQLFSLWL